MGINKIHCGAIVQNLVIRINRMYCPPGLTRHVCELIGALWIGPGPAITFIDEKCGPGSEDFSQ